MGTLRAVIRRVAGGIALVAVLVGVPAVAVVLVGWPLPTYVPDPGDVLVAIQQGNVPSTFVVNVLVVLLWVVWLQFAWVTLWEIVVNLRRAERNKPATRAPFVPRSVQGGASRLVASLFVAGVISAPSVGALGPVLPAAYASATAGPSAASDDVATHDAAEQAVWVVREGDTLWSVAESALGDGSRVGEILELNPSITSPRAVRSGVVLALPTGFGPAPCRPTEQRSRPLRQWTTTTCRSRPSRSVSATPCGTSPRDDSNSLETTTPRRWRP